VLDLEINNSFASMMLFPVWSTSHIAPSYAISRLGPCVADLYCGRHYGGYAGWCGSENRRRGLVGKIISPLRL